jgi:hypothetical protein
MLAEDPLQAQNLEVPARLACHIPCLLRFGAENLATTAVFVSGFRQRCASACGFFCIEHASSFGTAGDAVVVVDLERNKAKKEKKKRPCVVKKLAPNGSELLQYALGIESRMFMVVWFRDLVVKLQPLLTCPKEPGGGKAKA